MQINKATSNQTPLRLPKFKRRATLLMLRKPAPAAASALLATLRARSPSYAKPLRVLVVAAVPMAGMPRL